jgi:hypothetical protein
MENQQKEVREWTSNEACMYLLSKNKKKFEKNLPIDVWVAIPY